MISKDVNPVLQLEQWLARVSKEEKLPNPNAMTLATVDLNTTQAQPSARIVLCKHIVVDPGFIVFFTNYRSRKGQELESTSNAAAVFHWDYLGQQVRLEGKVVRSPAEESDSYFASRHWGSQVGAWASQQSQPIENRDALISATENMATQFSAPSPIQSLPREAFAGDIPRPEHWGGYRLWPHSIELWQDGEYRLHDRLRFQREVVANGDNLSVGDWTAQRLQP